MDGMWARCIWCGHSVGQEYMMWTECEPGYFRWTECGQVLLGLDRVWAWDIWCGQSVGMRYLVWIGKAR